jgi:glucose/mannose-6-phosphate isomerase
VTDGPGHQVDLDEPALYARLDPSGMRERIAALPAQAREAWRAGLAWQPPAGWRRPSRVVLLGMGGSAIGADVVATLAAQCSPVPVLLVRNYAPPSLDPNALVVACSFSGETEETLAAFRASLATPGMRLAVTTGGTLARLAAEADAALFTYSDPGPPRTAFGWALFPLLAILSRLGALPLDADEVETCLDAIEADRSVLAPDVRSADNRAKALALRLSGRVPLVVGAGCLEVAARRWASEVAENAKQWCFSAALPEFDHTTLAGAGGPGWARERITTLLLDAPAVHERNRLRVHLTAHALIEASADHEVVAVEVQRPLEAILRACYLGDWVSLYLAMLNAVDPTPMPPIDRLKARLAEQTRDEMRR